MEQGAEPARRTYDGSGRRAAAERRREQVAEVAAGLFVEHGWSGTTIAAVAREAGVSPELVTKTFGGKQELLMAAMRAASFGAHGGLPVAFASMKLEVEPDRDARLDRIVDFVCRSLAPMAPFVPVIVQGADQDPRMAAVLDAAEQGHLATTRELVDVLAEGEVGADVVDEVYLATRAETYLTFVQQRGWSTERYAAWLRRTLDAAVRG